MQLSLVEGLLDEAIQASLPRAPQRMVVNRTGDQDHRNTVLLANLLGRKHPVRAAAQMHVHQDDVGIQGLPLATASSASLAESSTA